MHVGSPIPLLTPAGKTLHLVVKGIFDPRAGARRSATSRLELDLEREYESPKKIFTFVQMRGDVTAANTKALEDSLLRFPNAKALTQNRSSTPRSAR